MQCILLTSASSGLLLSVVDRIRRGWVVWFGFGFTEPGVVQLLPVNRNTDLVANFIVGEWDYAMSLCKHQYKSIELGSLRVPLTALENLC